MPNVAHPSKGADEDASTATLIAKQVLS